MKKTKYTKKQISEAIKYWEGVLKKMNESRHRQPKTRSINDWFKRCKQVYNGPEGNCYIYNGHFAWTDNNGNDIEPPQKIGGHFDCSDTDITSLKGAPQKVGKDFYCSDTKITSLEGAPQKVGGDFDCSDTDITSLDGAPGEIGEYFYCLDTNITSDQKFEYLQCLKHQKVYRASTIWSGQNPSSGHIDATGHYKERVKIN